MEKKTTPPKRYPRSNKLSDHEINILVMICKELSPGQISAKVGISEKTYFNHRAHLKRVTRAKTNIGLYKYALKHGLVKT
jgi:DNA-binding CsgD family transcriptional regulator